MEKLLLLEITVFYVGILLIAYIMLRRRKLEKSVPQPIVNRKFLTLLFLAGSGLFFAVTFWWNRPDAGYNPQSNLNVTIVNQTSTPVEAARIVLTINSEQKAVFYPFEGGIRPNTSKTVAIPEGMDVEVYSVQYFSNGEWKNFLKESYHVFQGFQLRLFLKKFENNHFEGNFKDNDFLQHSGEFSLRENDEELVCFHHYT